MNIKTYWPWELPRIEGLAVVTDVWAATTNIAIFLSKKIEKLFLVNEDMAKKIKEGDPQAIIIGESNTLPGNFFFAPHLPHKHLNLDLQDKTIYHMSINGTRVIEKAFEKGASGVVALSFVNFAKVAAWVKGNSLDKITLIPAGESDYPKDPKAPEDLACVVSFKERLEGRSIDWNRYFKNLLAEFVKYYSGSNHENVKKDSKIIFNLDSRPVIPLCKKIKDGLIEVTDALLPGNS